MLRLSLTRAALAGGLVWAFAAAAPAQVPTGPIAPQALKINEYIQKGYESAGVKRPAARATDHEFIRRVYIDLLGRIATPEEVIDFEQDRSADKRVKLVRRLLYAEKYQPKKNGIPVTAKAADGKKSEPVTFNYVNDYAEHWANLWTVWLMTRGSHPDYRDEMRLWLEVQFSKNITHKEMVEKLLTATGQVGGTDPATRKYKDDYAANFLVHHLGEPVRDDPATSDVNERQRDGAFDGVPITSRVTKLFLGLQTQCTQCHDHPFNKEWVQADFWGVNAFFRQTVRSATPTGAPVGNNQKMLRASPVTLTDDPGLNPGLIALYERRDGRKIGSFPIMLKDYEQAQNGDKSKKVLSAAPSGKTRRQQLTEWIIDHDNFTKAYVNRLWAHFFGRGLNKEPSADDFGSNNEIVHPELLAFLGEEFGKYKYQPKVLMEWICTSDAYSLSHVANKDYVDIKYEPYFARMPLKAMSPEVLFESLMTATKAEKKNAAQRADLRNAWMRKLVRQFGDDEGNELSFNGTIVQALLMMNGRELNEEIGVGRSANTADVVSEVVNRQKGSTAGIYDELFLLTLNRHPTPAETARLNEVMKGNAKTANTTPAPKKGPKGPSTVAVPGAAGANDINFYRDVFWALLNTNEFMLNH